MYNLIRCHVKDNGNWRPLDVTAKTVMELKNKYKTVRLFVKEDTGGSGEKIINLINVFGRLPVASYSLTIPQWLATIDNSYIDSNEKAVTLDRVGALRRRDLWDYPVTVSMGNAFYGEGVTIPKGLAIDICMGPIDSNFAVMDRLANRCLMSVNGRIIPLERSSNRVFGINGSKYLANVNEYAISILDFTELGSLTLQELNVANTDKLVPNETDLLQRKSRINVTMNMDISDKTVLMVIDGYPHFLDKTIQVYDNRNVVLHLNHDRLCKRLLADDVPSTDPYVGHTVQNTGFNITEFDALGYIRNSRSFLIVIDNDDVCRYTRPAGRTDLVGLHLSSYPPQGLLLSEDGRSLEYQTVDTDGVQAAIHIGDNRRRYYLHNSTDPGVSNLATVTEVQPDAPEVMNANFIDLYTTKIS